MKTQFYILLSIKTPNGFENYGQYFLGDSRESAYALFNSLNGTEAITDAAMLHVDLMETVEELPVKIRTICCNLDELGCNSRLIAREIFKLKNLKAYEE